MKELLEKLYPLNRVPVSDDADRAVRIIKDELPDMDIFEVPSGAECWTWVVPQKWVIREAYITDGEKRLIDIQDNLLHVMSYSIPVDGWVTREELMNHVYVAESYTADMGYVVPERPDAIPWMISCYKKDWGFCIKRNQLRLFSADRYYVKIDSEFIDGSLKIGDFTVRGQKEDTIVIMTNTCHPAQVNDSISGPDLV